VCAGTSKQQQPQRNRRDPTEFRFRSHNARSIATRATKCAEIRHKEDIKQIISPTAQQVSFHALHMHTSIANQFARARRRGFFLLGESPCVVYVCVLLPVSASATAQGWRGAYFTMHGLLQCHDCMVTHAYTAGGAWLALQRVLEKKKIDAPNRTKEDRNLFMRAIILQPW